MKAHLVTVSSQLKNGEWTRKNVVLTTVFVDWLAVYRILILICIYGVISLRAYIGILHTYLLYCGCLTITQDLFIVPNPSVHIYLTRTKDNCTSRDSLYQL